MMTRRDLTSGLNLWPQLLDSASGLVFWTRLLDSSWDEDGTATPFMSFISGHLGSVQNLKNKTLVIIRIKNYLIIKLSIPMNCGLMVCSNSFIIMRGVDLQNSICMWPEFIEIHCMVDSSRVATAIVYCFNLIWKLSALQMTLTQAMEWEWRTTNEIGPYPMEIEL